MTDEIDQEDDVEYQPTSPDGNRYACGDWEVHYEMTDLDSEFEHGSGWIRNREARRMRRFVVNRGHLRWHSETAGLQLCGLTGVMTYDPIRNIEPVAAILRDFLINAFDAEIE